jgi:hypothetical protein
MGFDNGYYEKIQHSLPVYNGPGAQPYSPRQLLMYNLDFAMEQKVSTPCSCSSNPACLPRNILESARHLPRLLNVF